jgi:hypothetical protein
VPAIAGGTTESNASGIEYVQMNMPALKEQGKSSSPPQNRRLAGPFLIGILAIRRNRSQVVEAIFGHAKPAVVQG